MAATAVALLGVWMRALPCPRTLASLLLWLPTKTTSLLIAEPSVRGRRPKSVALAEAIAKEVASEVPEASAETAMSAAVEASEETVEVTATDVAALEGHTEIAEVATADVEATETATTVAPNSPQALPLLASKHLGKSLSFLLSKTRRRSLRLLFLLSRHP